MSPPTQRFTDSGRIREWLTEPEIKLLIAQELKPFHEENKENFKDLFRAVGAVKETISEWRGGQRTANWLLGILLVVIGLLIAFYRR